jgi:hypothetical protein
MAVVQSSAKAIPDARNVAAVVALPMSRALRPKQVRAATLLVLGQQGKDVAATIGVAPETLSRWRQRPEFEALMHELLRDTIDSARFGLVSLCAESVEHLRGLVRSFDDETALKAISLVLSKVGPVLAVVGKEMQRPASE